MLVETLTCMLHRQYVNAPDQPGVTVEPYYGMADGRLDVAVLDGDENVIVAGEAEQSNNDTLRAVPDDFDKMAACTPDEAIWLVPNRTVGHEVKRALSNPLDGQPCLPDRYADGTRLVHMDYDEPRLTELVSI